MILTFRPMPPTLTHSELAFQLRILSLDFIEPVHTQDSPNQFDSPFAYSQPSGLLLHLRQALGKYLARSWQVLRYSMGLLYAC